MERHILWNINKWDKKLLEIQNELATLDHLPKKDQAKRLHWCWLSLLRFREDEIPTARFITTEYKRKGFHNPQRRG